MQSGETLDRSGPHSHEVRAADGPLLGYSLITSHVFRESNRTRIARNILYGRRRVTYWHGMLLPTSIR